MAEKVGEVYLEVGAVIDSFLVALEKAKDKAKELEKSFDATGAKIAKVGQGLTDFGKKMSTFVTLPIAAAGAASIKYASDTAESLNKVDVAFGNSASSVVEWSKTTLKSYGISQQGALDSAATFGDMGTAMGISQSAAADMSKTLVGLGGDLASFKNISTDQAFTALRGVFTGEGESLKTLGIIMQDSTLQAFALANGMKTSYKDMDQAQKVALRYQYVLNATKNSQGDFARTSGGAANQMRIFQESMKELAANFGSVILPAFTGIITKINEFLGWLGQLDDSTKTFIITTAGLLAALGPVIAIVGKLISTYGAFHTVIKAVQVGLAGQAITGTASTGAMVAHRVATIAATIATKAFNLALKANPVLLIIGGMVALAGAVYGLIKAFSDNRTEVEKAADAQERYNAALEGTLEVTADVERSNKQLLKMYDFENKNRKEQIEILKTSIKTHDLFLSTMDKESELYDTRLKKRSLQQQELTALENQVETERVSAAKAASQKWLDDRRKAQEKWNKFNEEFGKNEVELEKMRFAAANSELDNDLKRKLITQDQANKAKENLQLQHEQNLTEIARAENERRMQMVQAVLSTTGGIVSGLGELYSMQASNRIAEIDNEKTRRIEALDEWFTTEQDVIETSSATQVERDNRMKALDEERARREVAIEKQLDKEKRKVQREAAKRQKDIAIVETIISTATGAMAAYKALAGIPFVGPALGAAAAAAITGMGAAKIALIKAQPLPLAAEGIYAESPYIGGEAGPELAFPLSSERGRKAMALMADTMIDRANERSQTPSQATVQSNQSVVQTIKGDVILFGEKIGKFISDGTRDGEILIYSRGVV